MKKRTKILFAIIGALIVLMIGGWLYLRSQIYQPSQSATKVAKQATTTEPQLYFKSKLTTTPEVIFYPGALVEPASYSIWAKRVAAAGFPVYIVRFPMDLAVLAPNKANQVQDKTNRGYVIGGHSLGGVMASRYAKTHQKHLKGVFFLASYPDKKGSLKKTNSSVLSITATRDGVLNQSAYQKAKRYLPKQTEYARIKGGNHAGFGSYGTQKGDRDATISDQSQQRQVAKRLIQWLHTLN